MELGRRSVTKQMEHKFENCGVMVVSLAESRTHGSLCMHAKLWSASINCKGGN